MKLLSLRSIPLLFLLLVCTWASVSPQTQESVKVIGITDGDTITVLDSQKVSFKVRLAGIDAPEKSQDFGSRSKQNLSRIVFGRIVQLEGDKTDRWGRRVAKVIINGTDANLEQV